MRDEEDGCGKRITISKSESKWPRMTEATQMDEEKLVNLEINKLMEESESIYSFFPPFNQIFASTKSLNPSAAGGGGREAPT
jgi:hypothetical protein